MNEEMARAQWGRVRTHLREEYGDAAFKSWLKPLALAEVMGGRVRIAVPTRFLRDWVLAHYGERLRALWQKEDPAISAIEVVVQPIMTPIEPAPAKPAALAKAAAEPANGTALPSAEEFGAPLDPRYRVRQFRRRQAQRIRPCRRAARRRIRRWCPSIRCSSMAASAWAKPI